MRIAYFVNQYPKVSHSFIRREILALERQGLEVLRFSSRGWDAELADADDLLERTEAAAASSRVRCGARCTRRRCVPPVPCRSLAAWDSAPTGRCSCTSPISP